MSRRTLKAIDLSRRQRVGVAGYNSASIAPGQGVELGQVREPPRYQGSRIPIPARRWRLWRSSNRMTQKGAQTRGSSTFPGGVCALLGLQRLPRRGAFHGAGTALLLFQACGGSLGLGKLRGWRHAPEYTSDASGVRASPHANCRKEGLQNCRKWNPGILQFCNPAIPERAGVISSSSSRLLRRPSPPRDVQPGDSSSRNSPRDTRPRKSGRRNWPSGGPRSRVSHTLPDRAP